MRKIFKDHLNTIDSVEWHHKGYVVCRNPSPTVFATEGTSNRVWKSNYLVARPGNEPGDFECHSLAEAKAAIEEELWENSVYSDFTRAHLI